MTPVDRMLAGMEVEVAPLAICAVADGRALSLPAQAMLSVHYALAGSGRLRVAGGPDVGFRAGTVVICPAGTAMRIESHSPGSGEVRCVEPALGLQWLASGAAPFRTIFACGRVGTSEGGPPTAFLGLRHTLIASAPPSEPLGTTLHALLQEVARPRLGGRAMAESLMKQALVLLLRQLSARDEDGLPWLQAMADPHLGPVAAEMLADPARSDDVDRLASIAGMSRSRFVARFGALFGTSPHAFLTRCRMQRAARLLATTDLPVKVVAGQVGYRSRSHFSRAFKRSHGRDPASWRLDRSATAADAASDDPWSRSRDAP